MEKLIKNRKEKLSGSGFSDKRITEKNVLKPVFIMIDDYGTFREMTEDAYQSHIEKVAKEGAALGIFLVLTALGVGGGEVPPKLHEFMQKTLSLGMNDPLRYPEILRQYRIQTLPAEGVPGRGLCVENGEVFEMQIPVIFKWDAYEELKGESPDTERFCRLPDKPSFEELTEGWKKSLKKALKKDVLPIGYQMNCGKIQEISVNKHFPFLISGEEGSGETAVMHNLIACLTDMGISGAVFGDEGILGAGDACNADVGDASDAGAGKKEKGPVTALKSMAEINDWLSEERQFLAIYDLPGFVRKMENLRLSGEEGSDRMKEKVRKKELLLLAIHRSGQESALLGSFWYEVFSGAGGALHLGGNVARQHLFPYDDLPYSMQLTREKPGIAYFKAGPAGKTGRLLIPGQEEVDADDFD